MRLNHRNEPKPIIAHQTVLVQMLNGFKLEYVLGLRLSSEMKCLWINRMVSMLQASPVSTQVLSFRSFCRNDMAKLSATGARKGRRAARQENNLETG